MENKSAGKISLEKQHNSMPSDLKFGIFMSCIMISFATYFYLANAYIYFKILLILSAATAIAAKFFPNSLGPLNWLWYRMGIILGSFTSPIVLGLLFFLLITPIAIITNAAGRDSLRLKRKNTISYWVIRKSGILTKDSFKDQF